MNFLTLKSLNSLLLSHFSLLPDKEFNEQSWENLFSRTDKWIIGINNYKPIVAYILSWEMVLKEAA